MDCGHGARVYCAWLKRRIAYMSKSLEKYKGSCLCGNVRFEAGGFSKRAAVCHCNMCKKFHGSAFGVLVLVDHVQWLQGKESLSEYHAGNGTVRTFCSACGSSLGFRCKGVSADEIEIAIACFDEVIPVVLDAHVYTNYKTNWYEIKDDLPQHKEGRLPTKKDTNG